MQKGDDFISIHDLSVAEVEEVLALTKELKYNKSTVFLISCWPVKH